MKATELYDQLEKDFIKPELSDEWDMKANEEFVTDNFKKRAIGLVCDFTEEINQVFTAVFPSEKVLKEILEKDIKNALLFVHHPLVWDIKAAPNVFQPMDNELLKKLKENNIAIYNLHVPLDHFGPYSTGTNLASALKIKPTKPFAKYFGSLAGVFGIPSTNTVQELKEVFEKAVDHEVKLYQYGENKLTQEVAVVGGGGHDVDILEDVAKEGVNTLITGITIKNDHSKPAHDKAKELKINLLGGTHYSTEKFACIAMCGYFEKLGINSEFIKDQPVMEDM
jgi:putative NIF3 family GTP cyclohydrolase 1 type 2